MEILNIVGSQDEQVERNHLAKAAGPQGAETQGSEQNRRSIVSTDVKSTIDTCQYWRTEQRDLTLTYIGESTEY